MGQLIKLLEPLNQGNNLKYIYYSYLYIYPFFLWGQDPSKKTISQVFLAAFIKDFLCPSKVQPKTIIDSRPERFSSPSIINYNSWLLLFLATDCRLPIADCRLISSRRLFPPIGFSDFQAQAATSGKRAERIITTIININNSQKQSYKQFCLFLTDRKQFN